MLNLIKANYRIVEPKVIAHALKKLHQNNDTTT